MAAPEISTPVPKKKRPPLPRREADFAKLRPGEYPDSGKPGLRLRVTEGGVLAWRASMIRTGKLTWITLGRWPEVNRDDARAALGRLQKAKAEGRLDAALSELRPGKPGTLSGPLTVRQAVDDFLASLDRKDPGQARRTFDHDVIPVIGDMALVAVKRDDIARVVKKVVHRGAPVMARHVLALCSSS